MHVDARWIVIAMALLAAACDSGSSSSPEDAVDTRPVLQLELRPGDGYGGTRDTYMISGAAYETRTYGTCSSVRVGIEAGTWVERALFAFDLTSIASQSVDVEAASLTLTTLATSSSAGTAITPYRVTSAWGEGNGTCYGSGSGASWNTSVDSSTEWTTPGGDFGAAAGPPVTVGRTGTFEFPISAAIVQGWIDAPSTNHGVLLASHNETTGDEYKDFCTKEDAAAANRPSLTISYRER
jgi:hypothetical protein